MAPADEKSAQRDIARYVFGLVGRGTRFGKTANRTEDKGRNLARSLEFDLVTIA